MVPDRLRRCAEGGASVLVGTVGADGSPATCRGIALRSADEFATVTVFVPVATAQETIANIATTRRIAVGLSLPIEHAAVQLKGTTRAVRLARADEAAFVQESLDRFAEALSYAGMPRRVTRSMTHWPAFAIEFDVHEMFDQTPGPNAGTPL